MGLERRGKGIYYYRKRRIGKRVISEYCGRGSRAQRLARIDNAQRLYREQTKYASREADRKQMELDQMIDNLLETARPFADALYLINGYHMHSRQWRRRRNGQKKKG